MPPVWFGPLVWDVIVLSFFQLCSYGKTFIFLYSHLKTTKAWSSFYFHISFWKRAEQLQTVMIYIFFPNTLLRFSRTKWFLQSCYTNYCITCYIIYSFIKTNVNTLSPLIGIICNIYIFRKVIYFSPDLKTMCLSKITNLWRKVSQHWLLRASHHLMKELWYQWRFIPFRRGKCLFCCWVYGKIQWITINNKLNMFISSTAFKCYFFMSYTTL